LIEQGRLSIERKNVLKDVEQLRSVVEERDQAMCSLTESHRAEVEGLRQALGLAEKTHQDDVDRLNEQRHLADEQARALILLRGESEQLRAEIESLRQAIGLAEQTHRDDRDQQSAELTALCARHRQLQDEHEAAEQSSRQYQDRNQELMEAQARLKSDYQSLLDSGRLQQERWAEQLREQRADADETARPSDPSPSENLTPATARQTADGALQAARDEVAKLKRQLDQSERWNRQLSDVLDGMGINYKTMKP